MKPAIRSVTGENQKAIARMFDILCGKYTRWEVWQDFIVMMATTISNAVDPVHSAKREEIYFKIVSKYSKQEMDTFADMFAAVVHGLDVNPNQDLLGTLYMNLELGNNHAGQFFTPYDVCRMMSDITYGSKFKTQFCESEWISVNDCACGGGATLIAFANECLDRHVNYQSDVLFAAQDIDYVVACMCYIQLLLLGCAGYVVVGDSISNPTVSYDSRGLLPVDDGNVWYTPMYNRNVWLLRRLKAQAEIMASDTEEVEERKGA